MHYVLPPFCAVKIFIGEITYKRDLQTLRDERKHYRLSHHSAFSTKLFSPRYSAPGNENHRPDDLPKLSSILMICPLLQ